MILLIQKQPVKKILPKPRKYTKRKHSNNVTNVNLQTMWPSNLGYKMIHNGVILTKPIQSKKNILTVKIVSGILSKSFNIQRRIQNPLKDKMKLFVKTVNGLKHLTLQPLTISSHIISSILGVWLSSKNVSHYIWNRIKKLYKIHVIMQGN